MAPAAAPTDSPRRARKALSALRSLSSNKNLIIEAYAHGNWRERHTGDQIFCNPRGALIRHIGHKWVEMRVDMEWTSAAISWADGGGKITIMIVELEQSDRLAQWVSEDIS